MTRYYVEYQPAGRPNNFTSFDSSTARALFVIALAPNATILREWQAERTDREHLGAEAHRQMETPSGRDTRIDPIAKLNWSVPLYQRLKY